MEHGTLAFIGMLKGEVNHIFVRWLYPHATVHLWYRYPIMFKLRIKALPNSVMISLPKLSELKGGKFKQLYKYSDKIDYYHCE